MTARRIWNAGIRTSKTCTHKTTPPSTKITSIVDDTFGVI